MKRVILVISLFVFALSFPFAQGSNAEARSISENKFGLGFYPDTDEVSIRWWPSGRFGFEGRLDFNLDSVAGTFDLDTDIRGYYRLKILEQSAVYSGLGISFSRKTPKGVVDVKTWFEIPFGVEISLPFSASNLGLVLA